MRRIESCRSFFSWRGCVSALFLTFSLAITLLSCAVAEGAPQPSPREEEVILTEAARHFGVVTSWKPAESRLSLTYRGHTAQIVIGSNSLMVDDSPLILSAPVVAHDGYLSISLGDSIELFSHLLGRKVAAGEIEAAGLVTSQRAERGERSVVESVRYISYPRFTRLILSVSGYRNAEEIEVNCLQGTKTLTVELPHSRFLQLTPPFEVRDRIVDLVESLQTSTGAQLIVRTAPDTVKYEVQKYADPLRVVVDIQPSDPAMLDETAQDSVVPPKPDALNEPARTNRQFQLTTVVIDPGHGGKDIGARGQGGVVEKDVTLDIAQKLKELIEKKLGVKVVLTRSGDDFVSLKDRTMIANSAKDGGPADLFISIHVNSHVSPKIDGFEAYYVSDAIDPGAEATAARENAVIHLERNENDPMKSSLGPILWDLQFTEFISESSEFAAIAHEELAGRLNTRDRGVRQARFIVLSGVAMPSILVELGYVSNRAEESKLKTVDFRSKCAEALGAAVANFKERHDVRLGSMKEGSRL